MIDSQLNNDWFTAAAARKVLPGLTLLDAAICLGLVLSIFSVYAQVGRFNFSDLDDAAYVAGNPHVQEGLTPDSIRWALTAAADGNWVPITSLSHILDGQLFGMRSGLHHLVNVLFHMLAAVMLYMALHRATAARAPSAFVALGFALHPLHVESVAWISERKDVLSAFFFFLALYCYVRYAERPNRFRYLLVLGAFALGLMSKPMLVTFPFTLLLFDIWPLQRLHWPDPERRILWEKLPFLALSAGSSIVAYTIQHSVGAVAELPLATRIGNALISYIVYIRQTIWPVRLAAFYSYPESIAAKQVVAALMVLLVVSALVIFAWRKRPHLAYLATGWFWYLGMLVPVIGVVQVGQQSHADRYTYLPTVGLFVMLAWGAADIAKRWPRTQTTIAAAGAVSCFACMALASRQTAYWRNSEALFDHTIAATENNWETQCVLGVYLLKQPGRRADAIEHFEAALRIKPDCAQAHNGIGWCLTAAGLYPAALPHLEAAHRAAPDSPEVNENLGQCLMESGRYAEAIPYLEASLHRKPDNIDTLSFLARSLEKIPGRSLEALAQYEAVLRLHPDQVEIHYRLALLLESLGRTEEAIAHFEAVQRGHPDPEIARRIDRLRAQQNPPAR